MDIVSLACVLYELGPVFIPSHFQNWDKLWQKAIIAVAGTVTISISSTLASFPGLPTVQCLIAYCK